MTNRPCVSVIMSSYNPTDPNKLLDSLKSIQSQTLTDWELILWDDGSDDLGKQLLAQVAQLDQRIHLFRDEENHGLAYGLNQCLLHSRGALIARMDDDDISEPERLEYQVRFLQTHPEADWVGTQAWLFDDDGIWGEHHAEPVPEAHHYLRFSPFVHPSVMFRRESLVNAGGYLASSLTQRCEDYELFLRMTSLGMRGYNIPEKLFRYREDRTKLSKRTFLSCFREMIVRARGFHSIGIPFSVSVFPTIKPMFVWVVSRMPQLAQRLRGKYSKGIDFLDNK